MTAWWIAANDNDPEHGWHWDQFFHHPADPKQNFNWGGPGWIRSTVSFARIERIRTGDAVIAYQAGQGVIGFARLASDGWVSPDSGNFDTFDLAPSPVIRLQNPIPYEVIRDLPGSPDDFEFVRFHQGSVFSISPAGEARLLSLAAQFNPTQASRLQEFDQSQAA